MFSSGTTAIATSGAGSTPLIATTGSYNILQIINEGANAGFFSVDGGQTWGRIPAAASATAPAVVQWRGASNSPPIIKRASGSDMAAVYAWADWVDKF